MFQKSGTLPDNLDEHVFAGKYQHSQTLQSILDLLEFLICKSQAYTNTTGQSVTLGIENIKKLVEKNLEHAPPSSLQDFLEKITDNKVATETDDDSKSVDETKFEKIVIVNLFKW